MALQSSTECNSYSLFSDILVFLYVFVIVYLNYEFHDIFPNFPTFANTPYGS